MWVLPCSWLEACKGPTIYLFSWFFTPTPIRRQSLTTIRRQIWPIFDPFSPKKCWRMVSNRFYRPLLNTDHIKRQNFKKKYLTWVVHKPRWQDFGFSWPPTPLRWYFLWYKRWQKWVDDIYKRGLIMDRVWRGSYSVIKKLETPQCIANILDKFISTYSFYAQLFFHYLAIRRTPFGISYTFRGPKEGLQIWKDTF